MNRWNRWNRCRASVKATLPRETWSFEQSLLSIAVPVDWYVCFLGSLGS